MCKEEGRRGRDGYFGDLAIRMAIGKRVRLQDIIFINFKRWV